MCPDNLSAEVLLRMEDQNIGIFMSANVRDFRPPLRTFCGSAGALQKYKINQIKIDIVRKK
jgi:hypothetical protein